MANSVPAVYVIKNTEKEKGGSPHERSMESLYSAG